MTCELVAPVAPTGVPVAVETREEELRDSRNSHSSEYESPQIPALEGARRMSRSKQLSEADTNSVTWLMFRCVLSVAELAP